MRIDSWYIYRFAVAGEAGVRESWSFCCDSCTVRERTFKRKTVVSRGEKIGPKFGDLGEISQIVKFTTELLSENRTFAERKNVGLSSQIELLNQK